MPYKGIRYDAELRKKDYHISGRYTIRGVKYKIMKGDDCKNCAFFSDVKLCFELDACNNHDGNFIEIK